MQRSRLLSRIYWTAAVLTAVVVVFLVSVLFLNPSSVGNPRFVENISLWAAFWAVNFVLVLILSFILARSLIKLFFEYQEKGPGSGIKAKLVLTLLIFSLFPALIMAVLAFGLINANLRQWFSSPSELLLESSQMITENFYRQSEKYRRAAARELARRVDPDALRTLDGFEQWRAEHGFRGVRLYDPARQPVSESGPWLREVDRDGEVRAFRFAEVPEEALEAVLTGHPYYTLERNVVEDHGLVAMPVLDTEGRVRGGLVCQFVIEQSVAFHAIMVGQATRTYQAAKEGVAQLRLNYYSILGLTTLAVIFGFVWLGSYIARRLTVPLEALAEGSRELAGGNLDHRVDVEAVNELGVMIQSFNRMAEQIKESRRELERANEELKATNVQLDERRRYIETILQNIATGVISIDESDVIRTVNEAALKMLEVAPENILNRPIRAVADSHLYDEFLAMKKRARLYGSFRKEVTFRRGDRRLHIAATMTSNVPFRDEVEYLVVLDDLTELIKAEKFAAWQEVARRLAHEIKNPLTPIQLCAQRVSNRFEKVAIRYLSDPEIAQFKEVLGDATRIIVSEAEILRGLVEEFSRFARLPICNPAPVRLHKLIDETLTLYDGGLEKVRIAREFDPQIEEIRIDPVQMQRVFTNLLDNSLDALADLESDRSIEIRTHFKESREAVRIEFSDNGTGIAAEDYEDLFLPYFSTKKKGTGLGLAIVRQIISEHQGFIRAEPNQPRGMRFIMELPV